MNIKFNIDNSENYYTLSRSENFGYTLTEWRKSVKPDAKKSHTQHSLFYSNLSQVSERIIWLGLDGEGIHQVIDSMVALAERLEDTLEKMV